MDINYVNTYLVRNSEDDNIDDLSYYTSGYNKFTPNRSFPNHDQNQSSDPTPNDHLLYRHF